MCLHETFLLQKLYTTVNIEGTKVGQTRLVDYSSNARWDEKLRIYCAHIASNITFNFMRFSSTVLGKANLPVTNITGGEEIDIWFDLLNENDKIINKGFQIHVKVQFIDVTSDLNWNCGIKTPEFLGVPYTFFTQKSQCKVTLYQDAHVPDTFVPKIQLSNGQVYEQHRCWEDIFDAITNAKQLIYITGWSVNTEITLIRDPKRPKPYEHMTLGELLKMKALQGVRVLMLVWDDYFGNMATHDKETKKYFQGTQVHCVLCHRTPVDADLLTEFTFTHHQKIVVVDSKLPSGNSNQRRIVSFVGGIDLCDGRYDTQFHSLFRTLSNVHHDDFHQPNFKNASIRKGGPREPWHDIHCRLEGPAAWDVLINFEQRWSKQGTNKDLLIDVQDKTKFVLPSFVTFPDDQNTWNVQVFRSIDSDAALIFHDSPKKAADPGLLSAQDGVIDRSIQDAYIHAIRRAKRFIYIENQYFIGSSFDWKQEYIFGWGKIGATNLIPKELSLKIVSKIEKGERFTVYVVLPMWPEGIPDSHPVQDMLRWQRNTMEMMYTDVNNALRAHNNKAKPEEYLSFFCLGNREIKSSGEYEPSEKPKRNSDYSKAQSARRFMIYVHSKMMIGNNSL